ncbi:Similar to SCCPDH: Saccharopine dehydrogenase-like oxidoreductase (Homo sapiens) [Cotesia congregata]|uniref:Similar to SCCPDH: Saccharopine dehydrogenase-like oxidoreductase (Homo sapiens) n=1 Tax=Cotesia congregata TaxID=51543 RepID=A0A8J2HH44_COTCN|nr:Similar to SCCPDH: Saccharopine dehydrogenase-like oxidoreductase (Homo sapiens) [Cotesia congregata]
MAENRLDVIIFGATGFTGNYTVKEAARLSKAKPFSWGIAGRNKERLDAVLKKFAPEEENISVIIADVKDEESLKKMAEKCKVVVNCCGPYRFYGEPVIKACIAAGTHHVDVSGEPQFMEKMQVEHSKAAQEAGVYIISACGFDSIPCDLGIIFVQQKFGGEVNSVETYLKTKVDGNFRGASLHYGTWESAVYGLAYANELRELRSKLYPDKLPSFEPKLHPRGIVHSSEISQRWSLPFPGSDRSVAYRSQRYLYEKNKIRPAQVQTYMILSSIWAVISVACIGAVFSLMTKCKCGRSLLLKYPKFFSGGLASHEGPSPEAMEKTYFSITLKASGWKDKLAEPTDKHTEPPNKEVIAKVSGTNPGYGATCTMLMISALTVLREADKLPDKGGVLPPGAAFANTSMIEQLNNNGVKFEIIKAE